MTPLLPGFTPGRSTGSSNNVPDPLLSADEPPAFTYDLKRVKGKVEGREVMILDNECRIEKDPWGDLREAWIGVQ
jgi:hypothetical protein